MHPDNKIVSCVVITEYYRRFHTHFIRGLKVRLFCSPQWLPTADPKRIFWKTKPHVWKSSAASPLFWTILCSQAKIWERQQMWVIPFCKHLSSLLAQIDYLQEWKVPTKCITRIFFDVPKSSFWDSIGSINLHFEHFDKIVDHKSKLKYLSKCSMEIVQKRGLVADDWCMACLFEVTKSDSFTIIRPTSVAKSDIKFAHVHFGNVWRTYVRLGRMMIQSICTLGGGNFSERFQMVFGARDTSRVRKGVVVRPDGRSSIERFEPFGHSHESAIVRFEWMAHRIGHARTDKDLVVAHGRDHSSDQKLRDFRPPYLTKNIIIREYLNLGKISRFHLNHFDSEKSDQKLRDFATLKRV